MERSDIERRAQARVGNVLNGKWTLDALLGLGGMAAVYAATHRNNKRAAIKILHPELSTDAIISARFLREGYIANTVGHPGAVSVNDDDVDENGSAYLVMDLLEGAPLEAKCTDATVPAEEALVYTHQLLDVLAAAHDNGILHRDIKPANLFVTTRGEVKVLDFGIARLNQPNETGPTQTGDVMGTPSYMSPEQARGRWEDVDGRSDLWAVGAVMFVMLTGTQVHEADTATEALVKAVTVPAPSITTRAWDLPADVEALVDRALAFDKEERFADARDMQRAVADAYQNLTGKELLPVPAASHSGAHAAFAETIATDPNARPLSLATGGVTTRATDKSGSSVPWVAFAAVLLLVVGGAAFALMRGGTEAAPAQAETTSVAPADTPAPTVAPVASSSAPAPTPPPSVTASASAVAVEAPKPPRVPAAKPTQPTPKPTLTPWPEPTEDPMDRRR